jgi:hypothetical protein
MFGIFIETVEALCRKPIGGSSSFSSSFSSSKPFKIEDEDDNEEEGIASAFRTGSLYRLKQPCKQALKRAEASPDLRIFFCGLK